MHGDLWLWQGDGTPAPLLGGGGAGLRTVRGGGVGDRRENGYRGQHEDRATSSSHCPPNPLGLVVGQVQRQGRALASVLVGAGFVHRQGSSGGDGLAVAGLEDLVDG